MKRTCAACGKTLGFFNGKITLKNGYICNNCLRLGGMPSLSSNQYRSTAEVVEAIQSRKETVQAFKATKIYGRLKVDDGSQSFKIDDDFFFFDDLYKYSYHESPENSHQQSEKNNKAIGAAIGGVVGGLNGGLLRASAGAAIGGAIGSLFAKTCERMYIEVTLRNSLISEIFIDFITEKVKVTSQEYKDAARKADDFLDGLRSISVYQRAKYDAIKKEEKQKKKETVFVQDKHFTAEQLADELMVYKTLLYSGDITQEEYEMKKKHLLSLK